MSIPYDIEKRLKTTFTSSNNNLKQYIIDLINRDDLLIGINQGDDINKYLYNYVENETMPEHKRVDKFPEWVTKTVNDKTFKFDENKDDIVEYYINFIIYILINFCGCNVKVMKMKDNLKYYAIIKIRLTPESLFYFASQYQIPMHLKFSDKHIQNARIQLNSVTKSDYDQLNEVNDRANKINQMNNYYGIKNIGYNNFINQYPYTTVSNIEVNRSYEFIQNNFMRYPLYNNKSIKAVNTIYNLNVVKSNKSKDSNLNKEMTNPVDVNSLFGDVDGFSFGVGRDQFNRNSKDNTIYDSYYSQKDRIFILNKVINEFINIDWLKKQNYVMEYSGLHNYDDINVLERKVSKLYLCYKYLNDDDLLVINYYYGSEIAHYFGFLNNYTLMLRNLAIMSAIYFILFNCIEFYTEEDVDLFNLSLGRITLSFIFCFVIIIYGAQLLRQNQENQEKINYNFGQPNEIIENDTEISSYDAPVYYDPMEDKYLKYNDYFFNYYKYISLIIQFGLIILLIFWNIYLLKVKNYYLQLYINSKRLLYKENDTYYYYSLAIGVIATISVKVFGNIYEKLTEVLVNKQNFRYYIDKYESIAFKRFIFNYFNVFFVYYYIAFLKRSISGCIKKPISLYTGYEIEQESCYYEISNQLMIQTFVNFFMNIVELAMPFLRQTIKIFYEKLKYKFLSHIPAASSFTYSVLSQDCGKESLDNEISDEYLEMVTQFGLIFTFGSAYPISFLLAYINNLVELRVDIIKLVQYSQRGLCPRKNNIGIYNNILTFILYASIIAQFGFHMFELFMISKDVKKDASKYQHVHQYSILNIDMDYVMVYYIFIQNIMFAIVFILLKPTKKNVEEIQRWKKKDEFRLKNYRNNAKDTHKPFMYVKKGQRIDSTIESEY